MAQPAYPRSPAGPVGPYVPLPGDQDELWRLYPLKILEDGRPDPAHLPDFLHVGGPRSATTWLHRALARHPGFYFPAAKETRYFTARWTDTGLAAYTAEFAAGAGRITGEFTTAYGMLPRLAIETIHGLKPDLKILYAVRDPATLSWSLAKHMLNHRSYAFAGVPAENPTIDAPMFVCQFALDFSIACADHQGVLERWLSVFPRENLFVYFADEARESPAALLARIVEFLGADPSGAPGDLVPPEAVKRGLAGEPPPVLQGVLDAIWGPRLAGLRRYLEDRLALSPPGHWRGEAGAPLHMHDGPDGVGIYLEDGRFTAAGLRADYVFDLWWRLGGGSEEDLPEIRQARILRQMNAELFYRP